MIKILFICHGNICRSTMAEFVMIYLLKKYNITNVSVSSRATSREEIGNPIHYGTRKKLKQQNIPITYDKRAEQITRDDIETNDYLIVMDTNNISNLLKLYPDVDQRKIYRLLDFSKQPRDIADPWYTGNFDKTYEEVLEGCLNLIKHLPKEDIWTKIKYISQK